MNIKKYMMGFAAAALALTACGDDDNFDPYVQAPEPPIPDVVPEPPTIKPKAMWIDAHANFELLSKAANIDAQLQKIKDYGMNMIYLDVKPGNGYALYKSDILPPCNRIGNEVVTRDYDDYLGYFLEKCEELEIDVIASIGATGFGFGSGVNQGYVFDNWEKWGDKCQVRSDDKDPNKTVSVADDPDQSVVMLTPGSLEVQDLIVSVCSEIVTKYPKIKGISLDYLRYCNNDGGWYGMGDIDLKGYAEYWGESVPQRTEIVTEVGGIGTKFAKWIEYRSMKVTETIGRIRDAVKAINPDCEIHLWASASWPSRYSVGQNWASKKYKPTGGQYTDSYNKTGFADLLDVFVTGAYATNVWISDDPSTNWNVEYFCTTWNNYIMGDCRCFGSIAAYNHDVGAISDATYLCLRYTDGYMNFELSHVNNSSKWIGTQEGINRYENPGSFNHDDEELY